MRLRTTFTLFACLFGWTMAAIAQPPLKSINAPEDLPPSKRLIVFHAKLCRVSTQSFKDIVKGQTIEPPILFEVPNETIRAALDMVSKKVLAEPSLVTTDGQTVSFLSGGELALQEPGNKGRPSNLLGFGTGFEVLPKILENGKIGVQFRFEQTARGMSGQSQNNTPPTDIALISGAVVKGSAAVNPGQSLVAVLDDPNAKEKTNPETLMMMVLKPELADPKLGPNAAHTTARKKPVIEIQEEPVVKLRQDLRGDLALNVSETATIVCPENIQRVSGFRSELVTVSATDSRTLQVHAKHVGSSEMLVTDARSKQYRVLIQVRSKAFQEILSELFPKARVTVVPLKDSLLLRGTVTEPNHIQQITEIAEQYAPTVLNHLAVSKSFERDPRRRKHDSMDGFQQSPKDASLIRDESPRSGNGSEVQQLRQDIKTLHQDVKRILDVLERNANQKPNGTFPKPDPSKVTPNFDPLDGNAFQPIQNLVPRSTAPKIKTRAVPSEPLSQGSAPSSFVIVRTARISSADEPEDVVRDETLGSGVVIESEPGRALVVTAAHLLKDYNPGKFVLQIGARQESEVPPGMFRGFYDATVILQDDKADIALLRAKLPGVVTPVPLAGHSLPDQDASVRCVGYVNPERRTVGLPRMVAGKVGKLNRYLGPENFELAGLVPTGFGGAAVLDSQNKLIGIATAVNPDDKHTLCSPAAELRKLLLNARTK